MYGLNNGNVPIVLVNGGMGMDAMRSVGMQIERRENTHIAAQAAGTEGHSNQGNSQDMAGRKVHTTRKA